MAYRTTEARQHGCLVLIYEPAIRIGTMARKPTQRQKVSFVATKKVAKPQRVSFTTKTGKKVSFRATKKVSKPVRVTFYRKATCRK